jgi:uncharacterized ion transporter superfamily protein YfcC
MKFKLPDTLVIMATILLVFSILTWIVPAGEFDREIRDGREVIVPDSYHKVDSAPQGLMDFLVAPLRGFVKASNIIAFIFLIGGVFGILNRSQAINSGLTSLVRWSERNPRYRNYIVPILMIFFSLAGATFGMSEEVIVFVLLTIPLSLALGYDSIIGTAIPFVGAGAGFAGAFSNPFTIGIAQGISELPPFSGWEYRILVWVVFTMIAISYVMIYARKVRRDPTCSPVHLTDKDWEKDQEISGKDIKLDRPKKLILIVFLISLILLVYGVNEWDWYIGEISGLFIGLGILIVFLTPAPLQELIEGFKDGAKEMMTAGLVVALSSGILVIAQEGKIIDTILFHITHLVKDFHAGISVQLMFIVQSFLNFFLPSGSGQAALTMPIMAPLSDILGISRQTAVLAFQMGDGLSNMIIPTSGVTMGVLSVTNRPDELWI